MDGDWYQPRHLLSTNETVSSAVYNLWNRRRSCLTCAACRNVGRGTPGNLTHAGRATIPHRLHFIAIALAGGDPD